MGGFSVAAATFSAPLSACSQLAMARPRSVGRYRGRQAVDGGRWTVGGGRWAVVGAVDWRCTGQWMGQWMSGGRGGRGSGRTVAEAGR